MPGACLREKLWGLSLWISMLKTYLIFFPFSLPSNRHIQSIVNDIMLCSKHHESSSLNPSPKFSVELQYIVCERKSVLIYPDLPLNKLQNRQSKLNDNFTIDHHGDLLRGKV